MIKKILSHTDQLLIVMLLFISFYSFVQNGYIGSIEKGIWFDEALSIFFIKESWISLGFLIFEYEANMSLFYILAKAWQEIGNGEAHLRILSLLFFTAAVAIFYLTLKAACSRRTALIFLILMLSHFYLARYSVEIRGYALTMLFLSIITSSWYYYISTSKTWALFFYGVAAALSVYTHLFASLFVIILGLIALIHISDKTQKRNWILINTAVALCWLPMMIFALAKDKGQLAWVEIPSPRAILDLFYMYTGASPQAPNAIRRMLLVTGFTLSMLIIFRYYLGVRQKNKSLTRDNLAFYFLLCAIAPAIIIMAISQIKPIFSSRYFVYFTPLFMAALAITLDRFDRKLSLPILFVMTLFLISSSNHYQKRDTVPWRTIASDINYACSQGKKVGGVFTSANIQTAVLFYKDCLEQVLPFKVTAEKYLWSSSQYPQQLDLNSELDEIWIITGHTRNSFEEVTKAYQRQVQLTYKNCHSWSGNAAPSAVLICRK